MRFVKRNCKNQTTTNTTSSTSNNNSGIVGNSTNNTSGGGNYTHPTGSLWGNKYTGKEILDGDLTSKGTIQAMTVAGTNVTATNVTATNVNSETITGTNIIGETITGTTVNGNTGNFQKANVTDTLSANTALLDNATIKQLYVSGSAHFVELIIDKINSTEGSLILSPAHAELSRVETTDNIVKCYFKATDGEKKITNDFAADDLVICESFNVSEGYNENVSNKFVWKRIIETGTTEDGSEHWFSVYVTGQGYVAANYVSYQTNSEFESGDIVCVLGNATNDARQDAILLSATNPNFVEIGHCESSEVVGDTFEVTKTGVRGVSLSDSVYAGYSIGYTETSSKYITDYVFSFTYNNSYEDYVGLCSFNGYEGEIYEIWVKDGNNDSVTISIAHYEYPNSDDITKGYSFTSDKTYFITPTKSVYEVGYYILASRSINTTKTFEIKFTYTTKYNIEYTQVYINNNLWCEYHLSGANTENTGYYIGSVTRTNNLGGSQLLLDVATINYAYENSTYNKTYHFLGTTTASPTTFTNLITNGTFDGSLKGWEVGGMKLAPTGLAPLIRHSRSQTLFPM
jgi:hypothetical protein